MIREAAKVLRARGIAICKIDPGDKRPLYKGWSTASLEPGVFRETDMLGILGGPLSMPEGFSLAIVDLDSPQAVELADNNLPPTPMQEGRNGKPNSHRYYALLAPTIPLEFESTAEQASAAALEQCGYRGHGTRVWKDDKGKEILRLVGTGGQCVCPPSQHPSGEYRRWLGGYPAKPAMIAWANLFPALCRLASLCGAIAPLRREPVPVLFTSSSCPILDRARAYVRKAPAAIEGQQGHNQTFSVCRALVWGFELSIPDSLQILQEQYNPRCQPPWSEAQLLHKLNDASRVSYRKPRGYLK